MEVIAAKVPLTEAFGKCKCHQSCQSQTQEKIMTKGGPRYTLGLHRLRISLPVCYYSFPYK